MRGGVALLPRVRGRSYMGGTRVSCAGGWVETRRAFVRALDGQRMAAIERVELGACAGLVRDRCGDSHVGRYLLPARGADDGLRA